MSEGKKFESPDDIEDFMRNEGIKYGFVTSDNRFFRRMEVWDDALVYQFDSKTVMALMDLQMNLEMMAEDDCENGFFCLVNNAKLLEDSFKKAFDSIKENPITRVNKNQAMRDVSPEMEK